MLLAGQGVGTHDELHRHRRRRSCHVYDAGPPANFGSLKGTATPIEEACHQTVQPKAAKLSFFLSASVSGYKRFKIKNLSTQTAEGKLSISVCRLVVEEAG